jgi:hypothetical protein
MSGRVARSAGIGLVLGLIVGVLIGERSGVLGWVSATDSPSVEAVAAGPVRQVLEGPVAGADFELPVFNSGRTELDATLLDLEGLTSPLRSSTTRHIAPGEWAAVPFSVTPDCDRQGSRPVPTARLRLRSPDQRSDTSVPLPDQGKVLLDYVKAICASGPTIRPSQLLGVWVVEDVYGSDTYLAGVEVLRFNRDGSFSADATGGLNSTRVAMSGHYQLPNELLTIDVDGGYGCASGTHGTWLVTLDHDDNQLMSMVWLRGSCPDGAPGDVWVARRVLHPAGVLKGP